LLIIISVEAAFVLSKDESKRNVKTTLNRRFDFTPQLHNF